MLKSAPQSVKNNFVYNLKQFVNEDKFSTLKTYYDYLTKSILDAESNSIGYSYIGNRFSKARYFYFPTESSSFEMNCFERVGDLYFAFKDIYPESDPTIVYLTEGTSIHASLLFVHDGELYGADPTREYFGRIDLTYDNLIVLPVQGVSEKQFSFNDISELDHSTLEKIVNNLRSDSGVIDFFYESGQRVSSRPWCFDYGTVFTKIKSDDSSVVSEIRLTVEKSNEKSACIRYIYNPLTGISKSEYVRYDEENWGDLSNEVVSSMSIINKPNYSMIGNDDYITLPLKNFASFLNNPSRLDLTFDELKKFSDSQNVTLRFGEYIAKANEFGEDIGLEFLKYLRLKYGPADNLNFSNKYMIFKKDRVNFDSLKNSPSLIFEDEDLSKIPYFIKFNQDAIHSIKKISEQLNLKNTFERS